ncbi:hypothetical protein AGR4C_Cc80097 [Agrobacterium tumefaciens str. Kerr 14]|uniref:Uncharacterized protein n=1 Tax=Agrobacterium tumefaciens str. Kerr 14 TaxID=1183424 RepID=A0A1S7QHF9_AGRTU|nr:hypothetical protein AGR4C_Cc80097 [Agrobacterium tumefaciens str. Kerr 14]
MSGVRVSHRPPFSKLLKFTCYELNVLQLARSFVLHFPHLESAGPAPHLVAGRINPSPEPPESFSSPHLFQIDTSVSDSDSFTESLCHRVTYRKISGFRLFKEISGIVCAPFHDERLN